VEAGLREVQEAMEVFLYFLPLHLPVVAVAVEV
jgi:hypothetical protein